MKIEFPEIRKHRFTKDFSWGFYCTKIKEQAERWAEKFNTLINEGVKPYLSINTVIKEKNSEYKNEIDSEKVISPIEREVLNVIIKNGVAIDKIKMMLSLKDYNLEEVFLDMEVKGQIKQVGGLFIAVH